MTDPSLTTKAAQALPQSLAQPLERFLDVMATDKGLAANTIEAYRNDLQRFMQRLGQQGITTVDQVQRDDVVSLLRNLQELGLSPATLARNLTSIKRFYRFHLRQAQVQHDPTEGLEPPRQERKLPEFLSLEEIERLMTGPNIDEPLGRRDRAILELLYACGLRVSELMALDLASLLLDNALVRVHGKGARERLVPIGRQALEHLQYYLRHVRPHLAGPQTDTAVFLNAHGRGLSRMGIWKIHQAAAERAALGRKTSPHILRHSFAAHLLEGGASLRDVQQLLGHAALSTTQIYTHIDSKYLKEIHKTYHPRG
jgi:integrase/recombinase XerD